MNRFAEGISMRYDHPDPDRRKQYTKKDVERAGWIGFSIGTLFGLVAIMLILRYGVS